MIHVCEDWFFFEVLPLRNARNHIWREELPNFQDPEAGQNAQDSGTFFEVLQKSYRLQVIE